MLFGYFFWISLTISASSDLANFKEIYAIANELKIDTKLKNKIVFIIFPPYFLGYNNSAYFFIY